MTTPAEAQSLNDRIDAALRCDEPTTVWLMGAHNLGGNNWRLELLRTRRILDARIGALQALLDEIDTRLPEETDDDGR